MSEQKEFSTYLAKVNDTYMPMIQRQMEMASVSFTEYQRRCVMNAIGSINQMLDANGVTWGDPALDQSNITQVLFNVASLELNSVAEPRECYFQLRNVKKKGKDGKDVWQKKIEFGIEGDGYDAILARFGRGVKKVYPFWLVREGDKFEYPKFTGLEMSPPVWEPKGAGKVVRVVYPVLHDDNTVHFYIGEREDVVKNLLAHINNNLMNETFGIAKSRFDASAAEKKKIDEKKQALKAKAKQLGLDAISDPELAPFISPSWKEDFSQESMIIRKIRNNIVKKIPKDFGHSFIQESYMESTDEGYKQAKEDVIENTATIHVEDIAPDSVPDSPVHEVSDEGQGNTRPESETGSEGVTASLEGRQKPDFN